MGGGEMSSRIPKYKVLLLGDSEVGKTSLLLRFCTGEYDETTIRSTLTIDSKSKYIAVNGTDMEFEVHDTAGQERYRTLTAGFYRGTDVLLLVFDISNRQTFDNVLLWRKELEKNGERDKDVLAVLIGNKCDLDSQEVSFDTAQDMADRNDWLFF